MRERKGFIFAQVSVKIEYTDATGNRRQITKPARPQITTEYKRLTDAQKEAAKLQHAGKIMRETIRELRQDGARECKGSIDGPRLFARVGYTDELGRRRDVVRAAASRSHARDLISEILARLKNNGGRAPISSRMTFADLAAHFETYYLKEAEYVDGQKIAGVRSLAPSQTALKALKEHFGKKRLQDLTHGGLNAYRLKRLKIPTRSGGQRAIATVNRELATLRAMLNIAEQEKWITEKPNFKGLIIPSAEHTRERILSREEERRLLEACNSPRRGHLRAIIICAIDTGMRKGEILKLCWQDVDFEAGKLTIIAFNTKTAREREIGLTMRLAQELTALYEQSPKNPSGLVFGVADVKRAFNGARKDAGLAEDHPKLRRLRFHDLRHTAATRLVGLHIPLAEVGKVLGHSQPKTTWRYINPNLEGAKRAAAALDQFNTESETEPARESDVIN